MFVRKPPSERCERSVQIFSGTQDLRGNEPAGDGLTLQILKAMEVSMRILAACLLAFGIAGPAFAESAGANPGTTEINTVQVYNEQNEKLGEASEVLVNQAGRVEGVVVMIATEPQREVLVPIKRVKRATADKKIVVAATRDELKAMRKLEEPIPDTRADQL